MYIDHTIASILLVGSSLLLSYFLSLGKEREILLSSVRVAFQLIFLGFIFNFIFNIKSIYGILGILFFMTLMASLISGTRINVRGKFKNSFISIFLATFIPMIIMLIIGVVDADPYQLIPIGGLVLGNALNSVTLSVDRLKGELVNRIYEIEGKIALGADLKTAMRESMRESIKTAIIPKINMLQSAGIVHIPGITVGMLMAGADPFTSVIYQLTVLYLILFIGIFSGYIMLEVGYRDIFLSCVENITK